MQTFVYTVTDGSLYSFNFSTYELVLLQHLTAVYPSTAASLFLRSGQVYLLTSGADVVVYAWNTSTSQMDVYQLFPSLVFTYHCDTFLVNTELFAVLTAQNWLIFIWDDISSSFSFYEEGVSQSASYPTDAIVSYNSELFIAFPIALYGTVEIYQWNPKFNSLAIMQIISFENPTGVTFQPDGRSILLIVTGSGEESVVYSWTPHSPTSKPAHHTTGPSNAEIVVITIGILVFIGAVVGAVVITKRVLKRRQSVDYMQIES
jgi:WD40 repeat protein